MTESGDPAVSFRNPIICFSHLAWDSKLFQRPQQIMSRLARLGHPVYYFACVGYKGHKEKPMAGRQFDDVPLYVYTLQFSPYVKRLHGLRRWLAGLQIAGILARHRVHNPVLWFYHPALFALGYSHSDAAIVYDVMDHFPSFEESIDDFYFDELALLAEADIVFTGGHSLHRHAEQMYAELLQGADQTLAEIECLPSGVDFGHFDQSINPLIEMLAYAAPRFVYIGAVDERIDWESVNCLAEATTGSVLIVGPVIRQPPPKLPENVYVIGAREYNDLPQIIAACDVCLLPFKNSPLVQFVSPTKTPEYLAMGKPVVSTPIPDVVSAFDSLVIVADTPDQFAAAATAAANGQQDPAAIAGQVHQRVQSWEDVTLRINEVLSAHLSTRSEIHA